MGQPTFFHMKKKALKKIINAKYLERMNQINQGNELHLIPFVFFLIKWTPTIIRLFVLLLYM